MAIGQPTVVVRSLLILVCWSFSLAPVPVQAYNIRLHLRAIAEAVNAEAVSGDNAGTQYASTLPRSRTKKRLPPTQTLPVISLGAILPGLPYDSLQYAARLADARVGHKFRVMWRRKIKAITVARRAGNTRKAAALLRALRSWHKRLESQTMAVVKRQLLARRWHTAAATLRFRATLGDDEDPEIWADLARALRHLPVARGKHAPDASDLAYMDNLETRHPDPRLALAVLEGLGKELAREGNRRAEIRLLKAMYQNYPGNVTIGLWLKRVVGHYGLGTAHITIHANAFPTRTCVHFTAPLSETARFHAANWVTLLPERPGTAVTKDNGSICVSGLPAGTTTRIEIKAGLPAIAGAMLARPRTITLRVPDRSPQILSETGRFIIPTSLAPEVGFTSVNVSQVNLRINRVPERTLLTFLGNHPLINQDAVESVLNNADSITVWRGSAPIPRFVKNKLNHTILPLPITARKPGLYAIQIKPGDGTPDPTGSLNTVQLVLRTNLAPTAWRGRNGLYVQIRRYTSATPVAGVTVNLVARDNAILMTRKTNAHGLALFPDPILKGPGGQSPVALHIYGPHHDFTLFDLTDAPLNLSGRGISGRAALKPVSPYLWLDRGIYRPGEVVHIAALYRSDDGRPLNLPLHLIVRRPGGQVFLNTVPTRRDDDSISVPLHLPRMAQDGNWTVVLSTGLHQPALAERTFAVSAFVPPTIAVRLGKLPPLAADRQMACPVHVRYLYGAPGADLAAVENVRLSPGTAPFPQWKHYHFGIHDEVFAAPVQRTVLPKTNAQGMTDASIELKDLPDSTRFLWAHLRVAVSEISGRAVTDRASFPIIPNHPLIGIAERFGGDTVSAGKAPAFQLVAVGMRGRAIAMAVRLKVVRQSPQWAITVQNGVARWGYAYVDHPVLVRDLTLPAGHPYNLRLPVLSYGRYRLRIIEAHRGLAASSVVFYSGWQTAGTPGLPQRLSVKTNDPRFAPGTVATLHISAPFAGMGVVVIANSKVFSVKNFVLHRNQGMLKVHVSAKWGAGAYALVDVFRPATRDRPPERAMGLAWLGLKPGRRALHVAILGTARYRPHRLVHVGVQTQPGAYVTLAAVDQGILNLTQFPDPNPLHRFFGKRRLDIGVYDDYGALLARPQGFEALLENGAGASFGPAVRPIPQKVVALFAGPVRANSAGLAYLALRIPEFDGELRLMAVGWKGYAVGAAHHDVIIRNRVIARVALPRFLTPHSESQATIMIQDMSAPFGDYRIRVLTQGPLRVERGALANVALKSQVMHLLPLALMGTGEGSARLTLQILGPHGYRFQRHWFITVHSTEPVISRLQTLSLGRGHFVLRPALAGYIRGSTVSSLTLGNVMPFNPRAYLQELNAAPSLSLLDVASHGFPLTVLHHPWVGKRAHRDLQKDVNRVLDYQRFDGAFGLWSASDPPQPWLTAFSTEFLLRAAHAGAVVPRDPRHQALHWLKAIVENGRYPVFDRIYAVYDLSLAGTPPAGAIRILARGMRRLTMPLSLAQLGFALDAIGEHHEALKALHRALTIRDPLAGTWWWALPDWTEALGSPLRDAWGVSAIIAQTGLMPQTVPALRRRLPGRGIPADSLTVQELGWALYADGVLGGHRMKIDVRWNGHRIDKRGPVILPLRKASVLINRRHRPLPVAIATTGILRIPPAASRHGMIVNRSFYALSGHKIEPTALPQNTVFVAVLTGRATDPFPHHTLLNMGLPPGWEFVSTVDPGNHPEEPWLHGLTTPDESAATDDRYEAAMTLPAAANTVLRPPAPAPSTVNAPAPAFRIAILLRAVTPGHYKLPGLVLGDIFHPSVFARTAGMAVTVTQPTP